jgi:hypothetical protein
MEGSGDAPAMDGGGDEPAIEAEGMSRRWMAVGMGWRGARMRERWGSRGGARWLGEEDDANTYENKPTYENKLVVFFTYHGFVTIASSSRIISRD